jgi:hypothetical protein
VALRAHSVQPVKTKVHSKQQEGTRQTAALQLQLQLQLRVGQAAGVTLCSCIRGPSGRSRRCAACRVALQLLLQAVPWMRMA